MNHKNFFVNYYQEISKLLKNIDANLITNSVNLIKKRLNSNSTIYIIGNGGSASIASHVSVDFTKVAGIKSQTFNNSNIITCFSNDYGHDNWVKEAIKAYCSKEDLFIIISSSGKSLNMINAAKYCKKNQYDLITLSGFKNNNKLLKLGKVNFHVSSKNYNHIEMIHHIILLSIVDIFAKQKN